MVGIKTKDRGASGQARRCFSQTIKSDSKAPDRQPPRCVEGIAPWSRRAGAPMGQATGGALCARAGSTRESAAAGPGAASKTRSMRLQDGWRGVLQLLAGQLPLIRPECRESWDDRALRHEVGPCLKNSQGGATRSAHRQMQTRQRAERVALAGASPCCCSFRRDARGRDSDRDPDPFTLEM